MTPSASPIHRRNTACTRRLRNYSRVVKHAEENRTRTLSRPGVHDDFQTKAQEDQGSDRQGDETAYLLHRCCGLNAEITMCGICGFTGSPDPSMLRRMTDRIAHRGPDDVSHFETVDLSLGMRRLAIVDVAGGGQPLFNEDGRLAVVFNGEIYNHRALRTELEAMGHRFRSDHADGEVLAHAYEAWGEAFLSRLQGMFSLALWDAGRRRLFLARDRVGIKPLYFTRQGERLLFASEIKALLADPAVGREPDYRALYHYFSFKNVPAPWSAYAGIEQLRPGEWLSYEDGRIERGHWWRPDFSTHVGLDEAEAATELRRLLEAAMESHRQADVPLAAYLSGGLDSSAVVALLARSSSTPIQTFSLVYDDDFPGKAADRHWAREVSRLYGTEHHECRIGAADVIASLEAVQTAFDEPFSGVTSTWFVTRAIAGHAKVALSGDGADELFGSYLPHRLAQPLYYLAARDGRLEGADLLALAPFAEQTEYLQGLLARGDEVARRAGLLLWDDADKQALFTPAMVELSGGASSEALLRDAYAGAGTDDPLNRALYCDFTTLLPDQVLAFVDRLSMAHSVEVRPPFLDHPLVEFVQRLPGTMKIRQGRVKHLLKEALRGLLPDALIDRPKEGFVLPLDAWLAGPLAPLARSLLAPERLARHGLLRPEAVTGLLEAHIAGRANYGPRLWNLMQFQRWWERYHG